VEKKSATKSCFLISPIGEAGTDTRQRADAVQRHIVKPQLALRGFEVIRADQIAEPGLITAQVVQHLIKDDLVIADLTGRNANVFYELAVRHATRKPLIQMIQRDESIPFDVAGMRTIPYDLNDLDSVEEAKNALGAAADATMDDGTVFGGPITSALNITCLSESDRPTDKALSGLADQVAELRATITHALTQMAVLTQRAAREEAAVAKHVDVAKMLEERRLLTCAVQELDAFDVDRHRVQNLIDRIDRALGRAMP